MFSENLRSVSSLGDKAKSDEKSHSLEGFEGLTMVEGERAYCFLESDGPVWMDLAVFSVFILFSSSISERLFEIARIIFLY